MEQSFEDRASAVKRVVVVIDLAGFAKAFQQRSDLQLAAFVDAYYGICQRAIADAGGRVVKFMGDACLAVFEEEQASSAVQAVVGLERETVELARQHGLSLGVGANIHLTNVVEAELGAGASRRFDVVGRGVNQTFLLGRGLGVRISEPVYRSLPSGARSPWTKHKPPSVYSLTDGGEPFAGQGKDPASNALRW